MPRPSSKLSTSFTAVKYPKTWTPRPSYFSRSQKSTTYKSWRMHAPSSWPRIWRRRMSSIPWSGLTFSDAPIWRSKGYVAFEIGSLPFQRSSWTSWSHTQNWCWSASSLVFFVTSPISNLYSSSCVSHCQCRRDFSLKLPLIASFLFILASRQ